MGLSSLASPALRVPHIAYAQLPHIDGRFVVISNDDTLSASRP
jgi:hypothetical protein